MNGNFEQMNDKAWKALMSVLNRAKTGVNVKWYDEDVRFLKAYCNDDSVNFWITNLVNCAYYPEDLDKTVFWFRGVAVMIIREQVLGYYHQLA